MLTARLAAPAPADPGVVPPATEQPVAATAPPPQTETTPVETAQAPDTQGPIPFANHKRILENARVKTETEVTQRFQEQYAPHIELGEKFRSDPVGSTVQAIHDLIGHAEYGPQIVSELARTLGSRRAPSQVVPETEPQPDFQTADGAGVYSAERLAQIRAYDRQQILKDVDQRLQPVLHREQQHVANEREAQGKRDASERMSKVLAPYQALPEFEQHRDAIRAKTGELLQAGHDAQTALGVAVAQILREKVLPTRAAESQHALMAEAVRKSTGSTSAPGAAPAAPAGRPRSFEEGFKRIPA